MIALCLILFAADDGKAAREILDRAVTALGGEKVLSRPHALTGRSRGTLTLGAMQEVKNTFTVQGLDRLRWDSEVGMGTILLGLNPKELWISGNGTTASVVAKETATAFRHGFAALRIAETLVDLRGKGWKLSCLGELKVGEVPAIGLKAVRTGEPELDLWFDKKTMLPIKVEVRLAKPGESAEMGLSAIFGDYRKIGERQHFGKMTVHQDGVKVLEVERSEMKVTDKVDETTFAKP